VSCSCTDTLPLIELPTERFLKKVAGKLDVEDALKRLDRLTNDEARMATAQALKATRHVGDIVRGVDGKVAEVIDGTLNTPSQSPKGSYPHPPRREGSDGDDSTNSQRSRPSETCVIP
jgi:hypothetical protein